MGDNTEASTECDRMADHECELCLNCVWRNQDKVDDCLDDGSLRKGTAENFSISRSEHRCGSVSDK